MSDSTRRAFLIVAGTGAAAAGVAAVATPASAGTSRQPAPAGTSADAAGPAADAPSVVAYVRDAQSGTVSIMVGEREVLVHDRELIGRLTRAAEGQ